MKKIKIYLTALVLSIVFANCAVKENHQDEQHEEDVHKSHSGDVVLNSKSVKEVGIEIINIKEEPISGFINIPARLITNQDLEAQVGSLIEGRVNKVLVKLGDNVKKGQTLMLIEGMEIGEIKASFIRAKADYNYAEENHRRQKLLHEQNIGSQKSLLEAKAQYEKALAEFDAQDKRIHSIGLNESDIENIEDKNNHTSGILPIKAPIDGVIVERNVVIGQLVNSQTNAFRIINNNSLWIDGQIYEKDMALVDEKPEITLKVTAYKNEIFKGKIQYVGELVDSETRTIKVRAVVDNIKKKLKPEMYGEMLIPVGGKAAGIIISSDAVVSENKNAYVFVAENDTTFEMRAVSTGNTFGDKIEIREGLMEGERIVLKGTFYLKSELKKDELEGHEH